MRLARARRLTATLVALVTLGFAWTACVSDFFADGRFTCDLDGAAECPPGLLCASDGRCRANELAARDAGKDVWQGQLAATVRHYTARGELTAAAFGVLRDLNNALSSPPPGGAPPGTPFGQYTTIGRRAGGLRLGADQRLAAGTTARNGTKPRAAAG